MEYLYSEEVSPCLYETHGLCDQVTLRVHKDSTKEIKGALRAQEDWSKQVGPIDEYYGGLGDHYSFIRVTVPECLPERLEIISYANEYAFLYDDEMEKLESQPKGSSMHGILETFGPHALSGDVGPATPPEKRLQAQILLEMIAIDRPRAITSMKAWARFVQLAAETRKLRFETLDEYIPARVIDAGELIWYGTLTFGMGLTIPDNELDIAMKLARPGYVVLGLTNDLYSWNKERKAAEMAGEDTVFNAIWVIIREKGVNEEEAKEICSDVIRKYMTDFTEMVEGALQDLSLSRDLRRYIEAVKLSCIGNLWSQFFPPKPGFTEADIPPLDGKVFLITGGASGIGYELAKILFHKNGRVYIAGRSEEKAQHAITEIKRTLPEGKTGGILEYLHLELDDLTTIKATVESFKAKEQKLHVLWNNAGVSRPPVGSVSKQGIELQLATNCLGPFLLTQLLLPCLQAPDSSSGLTADPPSHYLDLQPIC
ncbi:hypothetical protein GQX73_g6441 [Xylaria multiplex]|uniref:Uncharacterized protein n=1 Tax=Xylaria multiplex TaxID=323545 RepID=A0A7C8IPS9_9PEZI|nr:hypothetical protein GQX73_g6441 [Xylaria multiplex]